MDDLFSVENLTKLAGKPEFGISELPITNSADQNSQAKILVPIQVTAGNSTYTLNAETKLNIKLNIDLEALIRTKNIKDRDERLKKMRETIKMDTSVCEISFV